jgi:hypothetical protein
VHARAGAAFNSAAIATPVLKFLIFSAVDTVFEGKRKRSPTTRTRAVLIADLMMLEREAALKPAR